MTPPNPLKPIQEALERVLHDSGLHDFGRSVSSIDDLTAEVQQVYRRVDDIERTLETVVPILERLAEVFEDIQKDMEPIGTLASRIPGSGSRKRRRARAAALTQDALSPTAALVDPNVPAHEAAAVAGVVDARHDPGDTDTRRAMGGSGTGGVAPRPGGGAPAGVTPTGSSRADAQLAGVDGDGHDGDDPRTRPGSAIAPTPGGTAPRPGATGYSPFGRPRDDGR